MYRLLSRITPLALLALAAGCAPSKADIDRSIREEMKTSLGVEITSTDLKKQSDGSYAGTATAANGDVYEVTTNPPKGTRIEWKAIPAQAVVERTVRDGMNAQLPSKVKTLSLTKESPGVYKGTAVLEDGSKMNVSTKMEGKNLLWEAAPAL
jgi:hypothetical protein